MVRSSFHTVRDRGTAVKPEEAAMTLDIPEVRIDWRAKGFWLPDGAPTVAEFVAARHTLFDGAFTWPLLVVRQAAVRPNIATMAAFCARHGVTFAPYVKT